MKWLILVGHCSKQSRLFGLILTIDIILTTVFWYWLFLMSSDILFWLLMLSWTLMMVTFCICCVWKLIWLLCIEYQWLSWWYSHRYHHCVMVYGGDGGAGVLSSDALWCSLWLQYYSLQYSKFEEYSLLCILFGSDDTIQYSVFFCDISFIILDHLLSVVMPDHWWFHMTDTTEVTITCDVDIRWWWWPVIYYCDTVRWACGACVRNGAPWWCSDLPFTIHGITLPFVMPLLIRYIWPVSVYIVYFHSVLILLLTLWPDIQCIIIHSVDYSDIFIDEPYSIFDTWSWWYCDTLFIVTTKKLQWPLAFYWYLQKLTTILFIVIYYYSPTIPTTDVTRTVFYYWLIPCYLWYQKYWLL